MDELERKALGAAHKLGHHWLGVEHLLLALTKEPAGSPARDALIACGVEESDVAAVLAGIEIPARAPSPQRTIRPNPAYYKATSRAQGLALAEGSRHPRPEHVLLAIICSRSSGRLKQLGTTPAALQAALARFGARVPPFDPPPMPEFGEAFDVSESELPILLGRLEPLLSPPEITVAVRREGDRAWVRAAKTIDVRSEIEQMRSER